MTKYAISVFQTGQSTPIGSGTLSLEETNTTYKLSFARAGVPGLFINGTYNEVELKGQSVISLNDPGKSASTKINQVLGVNVDLKVGSALDGCFSIVDSGVEVTGLLIGVTG